MARRRKKYLIRPSEMMKAAVVVGGLAFAINLLSQITTSSIKTACVLAISLFGLIVSARYACKQRLARKIGKISDANIESLTRLRAQLVTYDAYGAVQLNRWHKEIGAFLSSQVIPYLTRYEILLLNKNSREWIYLVDQVVHSAECDRPAYSEFSHVLKPAEFEAFCAEELRHIGWAAHTTKASRDQGVDVIAQKSGIRIVLQCKLYNRPVGNKAVQEIVAARNHERAHFCAVVSNNRYTAQAQQLAHTNRVALLHFSDLRKIDARIDEMIGGTSRSAHLHS